jgi:hypothetical protein
VNIPSIYKNGLGVPVPLPAKLAHATPDMVAAIANIAHDLTAHGGRLVLSDLFRSYDMQMQSHLDYVNGKKKAFSPAPGGSFHEAGRAMDLSLDDLHMPLANFWELAKVYRVVPIINSPNAGLSEAWHFECRGSHQLVIDYYKAGKGNNFASAYAAGAASAILAVGVRVDKFGAAQKEAQLQAALIRCGYTIGNLDGAIGAQTLAALNSIGVGGAALDDALAHVENLAQTQFAAEYTLTPSALAVASVDLGAAVPDHVVLDA